MFLLLLFFFYRCYSDPNFVLSKVEEQCRGKNICTLTASKATYTIPNKFSKNQCSGPIENKQYLWINYRCTLENCLHVNDRAETELTDCLNNYKNLCQSNKYEKCFETTKYLFNPYKECKEFKKRFVSYYSWWIPAHRKLFCQLPICAFSLAIEFSKIFNQYNRIPDKTEPGKLHYQKCDFYEAFLDINGRGKQSEATCETGYKKISEIYREELNLITKNLHFIRSGCKYILFFSMYFSSFI